MVTLFSGRGKVLAYHSFLGWHEKQLTKGRFAHISGIIQYMVKQSDGRIIARYTVFSVGLLAHRIFLGFPRKRSTK